MHLSVNETDSKRMNIQGKVYAFVGFIQLQWKKHVKCHLFL